MGNKIKPLIKPIIDECFISENIKFLVNLSIPVISKIQFFFSLWPNIKAKSKIGFKTQMRGEIKILVYYQCGPS